MLRSYLVRCVLCSLALVVLEGCSFRGAGREDPVPDPSSRRETLQGPVIGIAAASETHAWLGIPFAEPPLGELRWRAPRAPKPGMEVREALSFGPACTQFASPLSDPDAEEGSVVGSEDCLYLNIWAPRRAPGEVSATRLPVMVWIHGGGNSIGTAASYDGSPLAGTHDLVLVTVNYRLGPFGWFRHPALASLSDDPLDRSGNFGTLDLVRALEWVQQNIAAFGGDPRNVTIFGESAGGTDVFSLLVSPEAEGLFQRAVSQSGGPYTSSLARAQNPSDAPEPGAANSSSEVALRLLAPEAESDREAALDRLASLSAEALALSLRSLSAEEVLGAYQAGFGGMIGVPALIRDGYVLPEEEIPELLEAGRYHQMPVILGTNRDETKLFMFMSPEEVRVWFWILPRIRDPEGYHLRAQYSSQSWKLAGADRPASLMSAIQGPSVFVYRFDWDEELSFLWSDFGDLLGAAHGIEIPFVFGSFDLFAAVFNEKSRPGREKLSRAMMSYWAQFAYTGDPGRGREGDLPTWGAWDESSDDSHKFIVLDTQEDGGIRMSAEAVTEETILASIAADPRLENETARCELFQTLVDYSNFDPADHAAAGCPGLPAQDVAAR